MIDELAGWGPTFDYQFANLHMQAEESGLEFAKAVQTVANISNNQSRSGENGTSIREFLLMFDPTDSPYWFGQEKGVREEKGVSDGLK